MNNLMKEITQDLVNTIVRGETMVPICSIGPLLERIEELEQHIRKIEDDNSVWYHIGSLSTISTQNSWDKEIIWDEWRKVDETS